MNSLLIASSEDLLGPTIAAFSSQWLRVHLPMGIWLRRPQWPQVQNLLGEARLKCEGYFASAPIEQKWAEHVGGPCNWQHRRWHLLMFLGIGGLENKSKGLQ